MLSMFDLNNKIAVVTGAASGIGAAIAERFTHAGASVYLADRNLEGARQLAEKLKGAKGTATAMPVDVADENSCKELAKYVFAASGGKCDILVNNAGIGHVGTVLTTTGEDMDRLYAVNVKGILFMTRAFVAGMIGRRSGSVVNLASIGGVIGIRDRLAYCTTKFAVVGMTKCMALDHAESQVRFNCICPGRVETPFVQSRIKEYPDPQKAYAEMTATQALGRMGTPEEIAAAAHYLASDEASFLTGSALITDGGWSAGK